MIFSSPAANAVDGRVTTVSVPALGRPVVAKADARGTIHLLCDSEDGPKYAKSTDGGMTFSAAISVVGGGSRTAGLEYSAWDMAVGKGGRVHVAMGTNAWKLKLPQEEWGFFYANLDPDATAFSPVRNINRKPSEGFSLAADEEGNVTACWLVGQALRQRLARQRGDVRTRGRAELALQPVQLLHDERRLRRGRPVGGALSGGDRITSGTCIWCSGTKAGAEMARTRVSRTPWKIDACPMTYYTVSRDRGGFVAVWPTRGKIYFARLDGKGEPLPPAEIKTPGRSGMRTGMVALSAPDGSTLVAWKKDDRLGWQLYDAGGHPTGAPGSAESPGQWCGRRGG